MATAIIPELVRTHARITTLLAGSLPERVVETLRETGYDILKELAAAEATTWSEFAEKVSTLVGALDDPLNGWLRRIRDSFADDLLALPGCLPAEEVLEAAE